MLLSIRPRLQFLLVLASGGLKAVSSWALQARNCWTDFSANYAACCTDGLPPQSNCFEDGRTFSNCCRCPPSDHDSASGTNESQRSGQAPSKLGLRLLRHFFGPLLCDFADMAPLIGAPLARREDFEIQEESAPSKRLMRVYMYKLPRRFNGELLNRVQLGGWLSGSECDYGLTACTESRWNGLFSVYQQFTAEVVVLLKFLAAPAGVLTTNPRKADLLVVPYLAKTDCVESGNAGKDPCWGRCKCATALKHLFHHLPHYTWATRSRHLFLATGDIKDLPPEIQGQPLVLSLGASYCGGHLVVPSPSLDPVLQAGGQHEQRESAGNWPERHIFAYWFGSIDKKYRKEVMNQLAAFRDNGLSESFGAIAIHGIDSDYLAHDERGLRDVWRTDAGSPAMILEEMIRSVFCPVIQGDVPHQKRLFDAVLTGCLPVVVAFPSHEVGEVSWWLPGGPPIDRMVPFPHDIDWRSFVVEVPAEDVENGRFVEALLRVYASTEELASRRAALRRARSAIRYDLRGTGPDAFTLIVKNIWRYLKPMPVSFDCGPPPLLCAPHFDCPVEGVEMYGHLACCPLGGS